MNFARFTILSNTQKRAETIPKDGPISPFFFSSFFPSNRAGLETNPHTSARGEGEAKTLPFCGHKSGLKRNVQCHGREEEEEGRGGNYAALWLGLGSNPCARSAGKEHGENGVPFQPLLAEAANFPRGILLPGPP